jgi:hypothetical protein
METSTVDLRDGEEIKPYKIHVSSHEPGAMRRRAPASIPRLLHREEKDDADMNAIGIVEIPRPDKEETRVNEITA